MGHVEVSGLRHVLPDGRELFADVSFRVGEGQKVALVGPNGAGKTTLLRMIAGDLPAVEGTIVRSGSVGVMRQFLGRPEPGREPGSAGPDELTLQDLALSLAPPAIRAAGQRLAAAEQALAADPGSSRAQLRYADALTAWGEAGGYDAEVAFDVASTSALGLPWDEARGRAVRTLSGGEQKRFALELLLRGPDDVLLLDEPDNFLDVPAKRWLEARLRESEKSVLYVSHDRELLAQTATRVVTVEGGSAWTHPGGFASWHEARTARNERLDERRRRWDEEHQKLKDLVAMYKQKAIYNDGMASRYQAAQTRLRKFEEEILWRGDEHRSGVPRPDAMHALSRYGLAAQGEQRFGTLSGGQQARFLVLLLELSGATLLLLDEPTDNLDLASAQALEDALRGFAGTVIAVTHDRWFARSFDRFLLFRADGEVVETPEPVWDVR